MAFSVMVIDPSPTAFLPPFSLRRRIIGCVCASLAGSSRSVPFGTPFPLASWQSPHPIYPCRKVLFNCQRTGGKRSPQYHWQKNRHFGNQIPKILFCLAKISLHFHWRGYCLLSQNRHINSLACPFCPLNYVEQIIVGCHKSAIIKTWGHIFALSLLLPGLLSFVIFLS